MMITSRSRLGCLLLLAMSSATAWGQLAFEHDRVEHLATPDESSFEAQFPFRNDGDTTVTVENISSSCGCTVPELARKVYAPGESGVVTAVFNYGQRSGVQHKLITVATDHDSHRLTLVVNIPPKWTVTPRIQAWRTDQEEVSSKEIVIHFGSFEPESVEVQSFPEEMFSLETSWDPDAMTYTLDFTPLAIEKLGVQRAFVQVTDADGTTETIPLYLRIQ